MSATVAPPPPPAAFAGFDRSGTEHDSARDAPGAARDSGSPSSEPQDRWVDDKGRLVEPNVSLADRRISTLMHLSPLLGFLIVTPLFAVVAPLIFWACVRHRSSFVDDHGRAAIDFSLSFALWIFLSGLTVVGIVLWPVLLIVGVVAMVRAAIGASDRRYVRYPLSLSIAT